MEFIGVVASIVGLFMAMEKLIEDRTKDEISKYVFGYSGIDFKHFERDVINGLMQPFLRNGKLRKFRVYLLSMGMMFVILVFSDLGLLSPIQKENAEPGIFRALLDNPVLFWCL